VGGVGPIEYGVPDAAIEGRREGNCSRERGKVGDLFNNGNMDVVIGDLDGPPMVLRNPGVPGRHFVTFELQGTKSNRLAIGARVKLTSGGVVQAEEIHSGGSYLSQNDLRVHFGLGAATKVDSVEIRWPSGAVEQLKDLAADKFYSVLERIWNVPAEKIRPKPVDHRRTP
jgi:enediyne biosynthesis protein E4